MQALASTRTSRIGAVKVSAVARPLAPVRRPSSAVASVAVETQAPTTAVATGVVHVLTPQTYDAFLEEHAEKLVVCDYYTDWCGPCKMMAPELERQAAAVDPQRVVYAKLNCGADNDAKRLAMKLEIKALPTFKLFRNGAIVDSMTGAKAKVLAEMVAKHSA